MCIARYWLFSDWRLQWNKRLSANLWRLRKSRLKFSRWIRILVDFKLSNVVLFMKSRNMCWGHYVWVNKEDLCNRIAVLFIYSDHTNVCELCRTTGEILPLTLQEGVVGEWNGYVLLITSWTTGPFDVSGGWSGYYCLTCTQAPSIQHLYLSLFMEKIFEDNPNSCKVLFYFMSWDCIA